MALPVPTHRHRQEIYASFPYAAFAVAMWLAMTSIKAGDRQS
jgi:hypothetical protein